MLLHFDNFSIMPSDNTACAALYGQVRNALGGLAGLPVWAAQEGPTAAGGTLPSFSAYPQQNVTAAGALCHSVSMHKGAGRYEDALPADVKGTGKVTSTLLVRPSSHWCWCCYAGPDSAEVIRL